MRFHLDWRIVVFTLSMALRPGPVRMVPSLRATRSKWPAYCHGIAWRGRRNRTIERILVASQIALAIVLLVGSGLLIRSLSRLGQTSLGFDPAKTCSRSASARAMARRTTWAKSPSG